MTQIALVTGANRGIGLEVCRQLAEQGYIVLLGSRELAKGQRAAHELDLTNVHAVQLNVTDPISVEALREQVQQQYGRLDVLINNAGINYDTWQHVLNADLDTVRETLETNTIAVWRMCQVFLPLLRRSDHGRIVNVSSGAGAFDSLSGGTPAYSLSKTALNALTVMLANRLKSERILVNAVCPGWVATDMGGDGGRPVADGAAGVVWAAILPDNGPTGGFFRDGKRISF